LIVTTSIYRERNNKNQINFFYIRHCLIIN
jgi:hypothetical protein